jgi:ABC-type multidrug transport system permease subunit
MRTLEIVRIFALKDLRIALTYRLSFVLGLFTAFYGMLSFFFVSRVVGTGATVGTPEEYFQFIVVGVAMSNVLRAAVMTAAGNARSDQVEGTLEILATQPISPLALALGWSALPVIEAILEGAVMMAVAVPLGFSGFTPDWPSVVLVLLVSVTVFLAIGFLGAAFVIAIQQGIGVMGLVVGVMSLAGGSIFPVSVLPSYAHILTVLSPLTYVLRAMRGAMLHDQSPSYLLSSSLGVVLIYGAVAIPLASVALSMSFRFARSRGSLSRF